MIIDIALLNSCNFTCDYCISGSKYAEEAPFGRYEMRGAFIDPDVLIEFIRTNLSGSIIQLSGGEPLTYAPLSYLIKSIIGITTVVVNTNGALLGNVYKYIPSGVKWRVSVHPEQRGTDLGSLFNLVSSYISRDDVLFNYVLHPRHIYQRRAEYALKIIDQLECSGYPFEVTGFEGKYKDQHYRHFDELYDGLITEYPICKPASMMSIAADGYIYPCHQYSSGDGNIGNIYTGEYEPSRICTHSCFGPNNISWCSTTTSMYRLGLL